MNPLGTVSLESKLIAGALALLALLAGVLWVVHDLESAGAAKEHSARVEEQARAAALAASAAASNAAETARRLSAQQENLDAANQLAARRLADARGLDATVQRLRNQYAAGRRGAAADSGTPGASAPAAAADAVRDRLLGGTLDAARQLAEYADDLHERLGLCSADYDALTSR